MVDPLHTCVTACPIAVQDLAKDLWLSHYMCYHYLGSSAGPGQEDLAKRIYG
jgi:hypothetical protein